MRQPSLFESEKHTDIPKPPLFSEKDLNTSQLDAVTTVDGPVLVIAGAGSGKTRTLVYRLAYLINQGISPDNILLLTFTRKAAHEMVSRAAVLLDDACQDVLGGTFHAIANMLLRRYGHHVGYSSSYSILDRADAEGIINLLKSSLGLSGAGKRFPTKRVVMNIISGSVNKSIDFDDLVTSQYIHLTDFVDDLSKIRHHYHQFKRDHNLMDYDDLLVNFRDLLAQQPEIRQTISRRFLYVMVDEYQDTNKIQAEIVRLIASEHNNIMVVGDDSQSIYSFRGADFRNIMDFPDYFPETKIIRLEENYRSSQKILETTNAIIAQAQEKYSKTLFSNITGGEKPLLYGARDEGDQSRYIIKQIEELHDKGVPYNDMAILFRSGFHSYKLELELTNRHIRFEKRGGLKLTETAHIKDVLCYLRLTCSMQDVLSWNRVLLQLPKVGPKTAQKIVDAVRSAEEPLKILKDYPAAPAWKQNFTELIHLYDDLAVLDNPQTCFERIMEYYEPIFENLYHDDYPARKRDLDQLQAILSEYKNLQSFLDDTTLDPPSSSNDFLSAAEDDTLILSTIHSAKGLEWDTVFVIHLSEGKFPAAQSALFPEQFEEERRLLYVAATRAKLNLFLTYPRETIAPDRSRQYCTISPLLAEIPRDLLRSPYGDRSFVKRTYSVSDNDNSTFNRGQGLSSATSHDKDEGKNTIPGSQIKSTKDLAEGMRVKHGFFGIGQIKKMKGELTIDVFFPRHGMKTLRLDYAKLSHVNE